MPQRYFDVVVLGMRPGALVSAALLARRDFRVLLVGDGALPATYRFGELPLRRRTFAHLAASTPAYRRLLAELAQTQAFRRRLRALEPIAQVLDGPSRLDLVAQTAAFGRELDRELPGARGPVEELYAELTRFHGVVDAVLDQDALWPPGTFWERRETARLRDALPELPNVLPVDASFRRVMELTARFGTHVASGPDAPLPSRALARLHGAWMRAAVELPGDEDEWTAQLVERIRAHGGEVRASERCEAIVQQRGKVRGVILDGDGEETGAGFVIGDRPGARLVERVRDLHGEPHEPHPASRVARRRFVVSLLVHGDVVPEPLGRHAFVRAQGSGGVDVFLQRASFSAPDAALVARGADLWVCEALLDQASMPREAGDLRGREAILATIRAQFPYFDRHVLAIDSPHDGAPLFARVDGEDLRVLPRSELRAGGGSLGAELAEAQFAPWAEAYAGLCGEPVRTEVEHLLTVAPSVVPALGVEGELIAAFGAARLVTKTDAKREQMRRAMWSKIEI